ncbi:TPA: HNH endonuclease [Burkholderia vietnamiensis]|nr:HNH endonuclease [Burkholderia vietnamiensis]
MTTTYNCALCNQPLSIVGNSGEHIVPNSIGGRRKVRGFICKGCNSRTGDGWDAELWRQFQHIALMHGVERDRGNVPAIPVQTGVGTQLMLLPDGSLMPRRIAFEKVANPAGKGFLIKATVRTAEEAEEMVRNLAAKHPEINVEEVLSTLQARTEYLDSPLTFGTAFAGPLGGRSMVKTAVAMAFDAGVSPSACNLALPYLLDKNSEAPYGLFYERDLVRGRPTSFTPHIVSVRGDSSSGYLMGYVEYFGLARIVVPLSDQYDGEALTDLKRVRWEALAPIRRLVDETPASAGVVVAGRSHYFSGQVEMTEALGFKSREVLSMVDFDEGQLADYLRQSGATWTLPDWVPTRPLLLGYLVSLGKDTSGAIASSVSRAKGWRAFLDAICVREAKMFTAVRPEIISQILSRVATIARGGTSAIGPISTDQLRAAFVSVNGFQPDEEGIQVLLRLPGLTASFGPGGEEMRSFADEDLAETAYGLDLAAFVLNPYDETNPLASPASWVNASSGLGGEVAAGRLLADAQSVGVVSAAITKRQKAGKFDAVLADLLTVVAAMPTNGLKIQGNLLIAGVAFEELQIAENPLYGGTTFQDCLIERLDMSGIDEDSLVPHFQGCVISHMEGLAGIPEWLKSNFANTEVERFSTAAQTTAGIMQLKIDRESRIALTVLKKVFVQRGSARKEGALSRGLSPTDRAIVPTVLAELVSKGWIRKDDSGGNVLYVGSKNRRKEALRALEAPTEFRLQ